MHVLTVCTGNICRSPLAAALLADELSQVGVSVSSAGTHAPIGSPIDPTIQRLAKAEFGLHIAGHTATQLTDDQICRSDLILALTRNHRRAIAERVPRVARRIFTLKEFARLSRSVGAPWLNQRSDDLTGAMPLFQDGLDILQRGRGMSRPVEASDDDIIDPYRRDEDVYRRATAEVIHAARDSARFIGCLSAEPTT